MMVWVRRPVRHKGMGLFLSMCLHQSVVAHDLAGIPIDNNAPPIHQHYSAADFQDKFEVMGGN